jgi:hypothetical protein
MRPILLLSLTVFFPQLFFAQFFVVKVNEEVYANGQLLEPRARISSDAQIRFSSSHAYAHILSPGKGHFVLSGEKTKKNQKGEFLTALKEAIIPSDQFQAAATRTGPPDPSNLIQFEDKYDAKAYFRGTIALADTILLQFNPDNFPVDEHHYFYLTHQLKDTMYIQALDIEDGTIVLKAYPDQMEEGGVPEREIQHSTLTYRDEAKNTHQYFGPFKINLLDKKDLKLIREELNCMRQFLSPSSESEFLQLHVLPFLYTYYGKMSIADMKELMN